MALKFPREQLLENPVPYALWQCPAVEQKVAHFLAKADRGEFPRPEQEWRALLDETIHPQLFQRYDVGIGPLPLWRFFMAEAKR
jgi:hypothetical protein